MLSGVLVPSPKPISPFPNRFKDVVQCEHIVVWAIRSDRFVASFRAPTPSQEYLELVEKVRDRVSCTCVRCGCVLMWHVIGAIR